MSIAIAELKAAHLASGMSYQDIVDETEKIGCAVSLSTVRRVFGKDSGRYDFRLRTTLEPIATVLSVGCEAQKIVLPGLTRSETISLIMEAVANALTEVFANNISGQATRGEDFQ